MLPEQINKVFLTTFIVFILNVVNALAVMPYTSPPIVENNLVYDNDKQRYYCLLLLLGSSEDNTTPLMEQAAALGSNAVMLVVEWDYVYKNINSPANWTNLDKKVKRAKELGMKVFIRIYVGRHKTNVNGFWTDAESMIDGAGKILNDNGRSFSFSAQSVVDKAVSFVKETSERYNYAQQAGDMLAISVVTTTTQEAGYHYQNENENNSYQTVFDYNPLFVSDFRLWLQGKYKDIRRLNEVWFSNFDSFDEVNAPFNADYLRGTFSFSYGIDWYLFRHQMLKKFMDVTTKTIKNVNPTYKVIYDYGSVYDGLSLSRSTLGFKDLGVSSDGVKINDGAASPHRFATDLTRSNMSGKWVMNEMFPEPGIPISEMFRFQDECFEHGCKLITFAVSVQSQLDFFKPAIDHFKQKWLNNPIEVIKPAATMTVKLSELIKGAGYDETGYKAQWQELYDQYKKPIEILLAEDVIEQEGNIAPILDAGIDNQNTVMGFAWKFTIPSDAFQDVDGFIAGYEATGLPNGLLIKNNTIVGTPTVTGKFQITVKGFDNGNASATTTFTLVVKTPSKIDIQLYKSGNSQTRQLIKTLKNNDTLYLSTINYPINFVAVTDVASAVNLKMTGPVGQEKLDTDSPYSLFDDNGGSVLQAGQYTITANSYGNTAATNALGWQEIKLTVLAKPKNTAPIVANSIGNQTIKLGNSFVFSVPTLTFKDAENNISRVVITGLAPGLSANGLSVGGKPTRLGSFVATVEATDIEGLSVKTQFTIVVEATNIPPYLEYSLANQTIIVGNKFRYDVIEYAFNDKDGSIAKTEVFGLPPGLAYKSGLVSGIPTVAGIYEVMVRATDNEGATASATFKITVKDSKPVFEVMLISGGDVYSRRQIMILTEGKAIASATLPPLLNIYVSPASIDVDRIDFEILGTAKSKYSDLDYPYGLYEGELGFAPKIGKYQLKIISYLNGKSNGGQILNFEIKK